MDDMKLMSMVEHCKEARSWDEREKERMDETKRLIGAAQKYITMFNPGDVVLLSQLVSMTGDRRHVKYSRLVVVSTGKHYITLGDGKQKETIYTNDIASKICKIKIVVAKGGENYIVHCESLGLICRKNISGGIWICKNKNGGVVGQPRVNKNEEGLNI